jgi:predicted AlkP superfamily phosphohydrolase/phosphomutase
MPALAQLAAQGTLHRMTVTLPEVSCVSWTSFMTGAGPGQHGIFGFIDLKPGSKEIRFPSFHDVKIPAVWDRLGERGKRSVVINQPATYPARPIPGALVSGFVALDLRKAVYPARLAEDLKRIHYELDIDTQRGRADPDYLIESLHAALQGRRGAVDLLWDRENWDYFQVVATETDRLQHFLWSAIEDAGHPHHQAVLDYYRKVDEFIGEVAARFQKKVGRSEALEGLLILSDHGFARLKREFNLNNWLQEQGYQKTAGQGRPTLATLSRETQAFALDPSRIYFNRADRFPDGCVAPKAIPELAAEMAEKLLALRHEGEPVVRLVARAEEIYSGPQTPQGPDLLVVTHYGYDAKGALGKGSVFTETDLQGMHTWDDAFLWASEKVGEAATIVDVAPLIESKIGDGGS